MRAELLPCPLCGGPAEAFGLGLPEGCDPAVVCPVQDGCGLNIERPTLPAAIAAWNRRAPQEAERAMVARYLAKVGELAATCAEAIARGKRLPAVAVGGDPLASAERTT